MERDRQPSAVGRDEKREAKREMKMGKEMTFMKMSYYNIILYNKYILVIFSKQFHVIKGNSLERRHQYD